MQQKITACGFLYKMASDGTAVVFLPRRADTKKFLPGKYELPGGHIELGEEIVTGLKREFQEEFGVDIIVGDPFAAFTYVTGSEHTVELLYFVRLVVDCEPRLNPNDHSTYVWASKSDISNYFEVDDIEAQKALRGFDILHSGFEPEFI